MSRINLQNKCLNIGERMVVVVEWNKRWSPSLPMLSCESSVSVKENPDRKKNRHINKFLKIPSISSLTDILLLRSVYDNIKAQICILENLDAKSYIYVSLLMPLLQSKIQNELNLIS